MVVKCKGALLTTAILAALTIYATIEAISCCIEYESYLIGLPVLPCWFIIFNAGIHLNRSLIMDEEGCTVRYLFIQKKYLWNELKIKRIEHIRGMGEYYTDAVVFSQYQLHKPKWLHPNNYVLLVSPFVFFYVQFALTGERLKRAGKSPECFEVNEDEFLARMKEWGVELEDTREKAPQRKYSNKK